MKLFPGKVSELSAEIVKALMNSGAVEVLPEEIQEVELDISSVLNEYIRVEREITEKSRDILSQRKLDHSHLFKIKAKMAEEKGVGVGEDAIGYLISQMIEALLHSRHVEEVFAQDNEIVQQVAPLLRKFSSMEEALDIEVRERIKNLTEGTSAYDISYQKLMDELVSTKKLE
jgi:hypothetical protein